MLIYDGDEMIEVTAVSVCFRLWASWFHDRIHSPKLHILQPPLPFWSSGLLTATYTTTRVVENFSAVSFSRMSSTSYDDGGGGSVFEQLQSP